MRTTEPSSRKLPADNFLRIFENLTAAEYTGPRTSRQSGGAEPEALEQVLVQWATVVNECLAYSTGWRVGAGVELVNAKTAVGHGIWQRLLEPSRIPLSVRTARMFLSIGSHPVLRDTRYLAHLPVRLTALYELSRADSQTVVYGIETGDVNPNMTTREARALRLGRPSWSRVTKPAIRRVTLHQWIAELTIQILDPLPNLPAHGRPVLASALRSLADQIAGGSPHTEAETS